MKEVTAAIIQKNNQIMLNILNHFIKMISISLSVMAANGLLSKDYEIQDLMDLLSSAANDVILSARLSKVN